MTTRNIARKITVKEVCGKIEKPEAQTDLMNVFARVTAMTPQETQYGPYIDFRGQFEAVNLATSEVFHGTRMIVPPIVEYLIEAAIQQAQQDDQDDDVVLLAFVLGVEPSDNGSLGYAYTLKVAETKTEKDADPFQAIRTAATKALPAPSKAS